MSGIWTWVKEHASWIGGGAVAVIAAWYLLSRPRSASTAPSQITFPAGGGGSTGDAGATVAALPPINLPYNPDFSILGAVGDAALRALYETQYNLEVQINQATLDGNTSLLSSLQSALSAVNVQIAGYVPAAPPPAAPSTPAPPAPSLPTPGVALSDIVAWQNAYFGGGGGYTSWLGAAPKAVLSTFNSSQLSQLFNYYNWAGQVGNPLHGASQQTITDLLNQWLANPSSLPSAPVAPVAPVPPTLQAVITTIPNSSYTPSLKM